MGLIIPNLNNGYTEFGGGYFRDSGGNVNKIGGMYHSDGKGNVAKIYNYRLSIGESLYNGIPSNGIMLYGDFTGFSSSNPLGIQGNSIVLNAPLSSCPNGIKIHFSTNIYQYDGSKESTCSINDIQIPVGSTSGSSDALSNYSTTVTASISGQILSFTTTNLAYGDTNRGTVTFVSGRSDGSKYPAELLAITSITAY